MQNSRNHNSCKYNSSNMLYPRYIVLIVICAAESTLPIVAKVRSCCLCSIHARWCFINILDRAIERAMFHLCIFTYIYFLVIVVAVSRNSWKVISFIQLNEIKLLKMITISNRMTTWIDSSRSIPAELSVRCCKLFWSGPWLFIEWK